ncbi:MAG: YkgJ family cysteine cluster protein [Deltaproteobacteria bacterium]|nr:YkgJ family cysteine cluster protein [Deltaproteobacteria bacterium]MBW1993559.1 YkgJ family cysteine cluster protein [Deltaproteobacteria bacterium]MBW2150392.1 YkgJ family cysteine cluster protein [Deltaproteobacteria bacterium]
MNHETKISPLPQEGTFRFACHKSLPCFTKCCADLELVLTPYDVVRLKARLGLSSDTFLEKYTAASVEQSYGMPVIKLKMNTDESHRCPFVTANGCSVYEDRPGACRIYPLGRAALKVHEGLRAGESYFLVAESHCMGWNEGKKWTLRQWIMDQGLCEYNYMNDLFQDIIAGCHIRTINTLSDQKLKMFYMACYSVDDFRRFVFETTFLDRFYISHELQIRLKGDDIELLKFAFRWLRFALFGDRTVTLCNR